MTKLQPRVLTMLILVTLVVALVACAGGGVPPAPTPPAAEEEVQPTAEPVPEGRTVAADGRLESPYPELTLSFGGGASAFEGKRLAIVGDVEHSRVARSNAELFTKLGAEVVLCGPATLLPREFAALPGVSVTHRLEEAVEGADAVMALRLQQERMTRGLLPSLAEYVARYQLTERVMRSAAEGAIVMHPGPLVRDLEVASDVADGERSVIEQQVANGVPVRMAVLYTLLVGQR